MIRKYLLSVPFGALVKVASFIIGSYLLTSSDSAILSTVIQVSTAGIIFTSFFDFGLSEYFLMLPEGRDETPIKFYGSLAKLFAIIFVGFFSLGFKNLSIIFLWTIIEISYQALWFNVRQNNAYSRFAISGIFSLLLWSIVVTLLLKSEYRIWLFVAGPLLFRLLQLLFWPKLLYRLISCESIRVREIKNFQWNFFDSILSSINKNIVEFGLSFISPSIVGVYYLTKRALKFIQEVTSQGIEQISITELSINFRRFNGQRTWSTVYFVIMVCIFLYSKEFFSLGLEYKSELNWQLFFIFSFYPVYSSANIHVYNRDGNFKRIFYQDFISLIVNIVLLVLALKNPWLFIIGFAVRATIMSMVTSFYVARNFNISIRHYYQNSLPIFFVFIIGIAQLV